MDWQPTLVKRLLIGNNTSGVYGNNNRFFIESPLKMPGMGSWGVILAISKSRDVIQGGLGVCHPGIFLPLISNAHFAFGFGWKILCKMFSKVIALHGAFSGTLVISQTKDPKVKHLMQIY